MVVTRKMPSSRTACYLGAACVLAALGIVSLLYSGAPQASPASSPAPSTSTATIAAAPTATSTGPAASASSSTPAASSSASSSPAALVDGTEDGAALQQALDKTSAPDLPTATSAELVDLGRAELTAQLKSAGTAAGLQILAAIGRQHDGQADVADVTLIYSITNPAALQPEYRTVLSFADSSAGWVPVVDEAGSTSTPED
jgi:hypothetical protein